MTFVAPNLACGEARGGRIPCHGAVTDEQRSHRPNSAQPGGRQVFFAQTSLLAPHRSTTGYARRSRLVWAKNPLPRTSSYLCLRPLRDKPQTGSSNREIRQIRERTGSCAIRSVFAWFEYFAVQSDSVLCLFHQHDRDRASELRLK